MSQYTVFITPDTFNSIKGLPGNFRQQVRQAIRELSNNPRSSQSKKLDVPDFEAELRRLRLDNWRILCAISEDDRIVDVLAVRKRPPYDYGDLQTLLEQLDNNQE